MMLFGFKSPYDQFTQMREFFTPYYELWTSATEFIKKKREWSEKPIAQVDHKKVRTTVEVDTMGICLKLHEYFKDGNKRALKVV